MRKLLYAILVPVLLIVALPSADMAVLQGESSLAVIEFKWSKSRRAAERVEASTTQPAKLESPASRNYERNKVNEPVGARDPYLDTLEGRSAAIEKNVQSSRSRDRKAVEGFEYLIKVQNASTKVADIVFWEYQFTDPSNPDTQVRRQFLCSVNIKPDKVKEIQAFSLAGPSDVVDVSTLGSTGSALKEKVVINRVEYTDDSIWQRPDWKFSEIKLAYSQAVASPWGKEMCRGL
jgi:hypothetical protein